MAVVSGDGPGGGCSETGATVCVLNLRAVRRQEGERHLGDGEHLHQAVRHPGRDEAPQLHLRAPCTPFATSRVLASHPAGGTAAISPRSWTVSW